MNILAKLLGSSSPFVQLQQHLDKAMECVEYVKPLLEAALNGDRAKVKELAETVFRVEHEADEIKLHIRDTLPRDLLLPVSRADFLAFLREQDGLADKVEDMAMMLGVRQLHLPAECERGSCRDELLSLADHAINAAKKIAEMTRRLDELKEAGFRGPVAKELREMAKEVGILEHHADKHQFRLIRSLLSHTESEQPFADSYTTMQVISALGKLANHAESMSDYLRLMIAE
ncbi:MAG: TIGR00153 family protein [bacterium]